jgi:hypothetical protein
MAAPTQLNVSPGPDTSGYYDVPAINNGESNADYLIRLQALLPLLQTNITQWDPSGAGSAPWIQQRKLQLSNLQAQISATKNDVATDAQNAANAQSTLNAQNALITSEASLTPDQLTAIQENKDKLAAQTAAAASTTNFAASTTKYYIIAIVVVIIIIAVLIFLSKKKKAKIKAAKIEA